MSMRRAVISITPPELAAPLNAPPPAPPAPPPCVRAGCDAHVMRATSNKESFFVATEDPRRA